MSVVEGAVDTLPTARSPCYPCKRPGPISSLAANREANGMLVDCPLTLDTGALALDEFCYRRLEMSYARSGRHVFVNMLGTLDHLAAKAQDAGMKDDVLAAKLIEDMFPLELQFRVALNQVLLALNQVAGKAVPLEDAAYCSLTDVRERIAVVRSQILQADPTEWADADAAVNLTLPNGVRFLMSSEEDIQDWILPNFFFHVTMAYTLLRNAGLAVGKMDFLPHMDRHNVPAA